MKVSAETLERVRRLPLFSGIPSTAIQGLMGDAIMMAFPRNTELFRKGDVADRFYIVLTGQVELFVSSAGRRESVIDVIGPKDVFDIAAIFDDGVFPTGARVVDDADLIVVPTEPFLAHLGENFDLVLAMMASISRHLRGLVRQVGELKLKTTGQRLGSFLLQLTTAQAGNSVVRLPYDKKLLAGRLGMQPESLSRAFGSLRDVGVHGDHDRIVIEDLAALRAYCEEQDASY